MRNAMPFTVVLRRLAYAGLTPDSEIELSRKVFLINVFNTVGTLFLLGFGINAIFYQNLSIAFVLLGFAAASIANYVWMFMTGKHETGAHTISLIMICLFLYLLCSGGVNNTGPLWCYSAAPFLLFIYGVRWGAVVIILLVVCAALLLFIPNPLLIAHYPEIMKTRFLASFLAVALMSYLHEYARYRSYSSLSVLRHKVEKEARTDELTGLFNRRHMYEYLKQAEQRMHRVRVPMSVLLIDIDNFKRINDNFGHQFGDEVLVQIADTLRTSLRNYDSIARWGGEEFLVVLCDTESTAALAVAEKLRAAVEGLPMENHGSQEKITISIGLHTAAVTDTIEKILKHADDNLYAAKHNGRNQIVESGDTQQDLGLITELAN